ncbi:MAG TPA: SPOR domain-containing protein [Casimicrobiaceae bacterium]
MAEAADISVDDLRRRARRRLVGAVVLALAVAVIVPMLLETEQKPLGEDVSVKIPPIDDGKFVNRLNEGRVNDAAPGPAKTQPRDSADTMKSPATGAPAPAATTERTSKYDTRIPEAAAESTAPAPSAGETGATGAATVSGSRSSADAHAAQSASASAPQAMAQAPASQTASHPSPARPAESRSAAPANGTGAGAATPAATPPHDGFAVQLAAFADDKGASALAGRLKKAGYAAYTEPLKTSKGTLWRVRVGPYPSREAALAARDKLKTEGQSGIVAAVK